MRKSLLRLSMLLLAACGPSPSTDTVDSLMANPRRLREVEQQCKEDYARTGAAQCNAAAEATRRRFMGDGNVPYTPQKNSSAF